MKTLQNTLATTVIATMLIATTFCSCSKNIDAGKKTSSSNAANDVTQIQEFPLTAGQINNVGSITISQDESNLYITYQTDGDWKLQAVHANIADADTHPVPESNSDIAPGQFPYKASFSATGGDLTTLPNSYTFTIPLSGIYFSQTVIYAHATVVNATTGATQSAWGGTIVAESSNLKWYGSVDYDLMTTIYQR